MTLWHMLKDLVLQEDATEQFFHNVYSSDSMLFSLRIVFAEWIEESILKVSPLNFIRGLEFQIQQKLQYLDKQVPIRFPVLHEHLRKSKEILSTMHPFRMDHLHSKFMKCFNEELVRLQSMGTEFPLQEPQESITSRVDDMAKAEDVRLRFFQAIQNQVSQCRQKFCHFMPRMFQEKDELNRLIGNMTTTTARFRDWNFQYWQSIAGNVEPHEILGMPYDGPQYLLPSVISDLFCTEGCKILEIKNEIESKFHEIESVCAILNKELCEFLDCYRRLQQASANGLEGNNSVANSMDIAELQLFIEKFLTIITDLKTVIQTAIRACDMTRIRNLNEQSTDIQCSRLASQQNAYDTNFARINLYLQKTQLMLYQNFSLVLVQQPEQVIKTDRNNIVSVHLLNFNNNLTSSVSLSVYLVNEPVAKNIRSSNLLPEIVETAGTLVQSFDVSGGGGDSSSMGPGPIPRKKVTKRQTKCGVSTASTSGHSGVLQGQMTPSSSEAQAMQVSFNSSSPRRLQRTNVQCVKTDEMEFSSKLTSLKLHWQFKISGVRRRTGRTVAERTDNVTKEKFCLLFVAELPVESDIVKVWTISLPMIITTHGSHNEGAWATVWYDNAFPVPARSGFEVLPSANWWQICEILKGIFKSWVGEPLNSSHVQYIKKKLKTHCGHNFPEAITWNDLCERKMVGYGFSFWCWFYRAAMVVKGHFKEPWKDGFIEGFIGFDEASALLATSKSKPGTFLIRFSDSEPGSISLIFIGVDGMTYRMQPIEVYKKKSFEDCCTSFLEKLDVKEQRRRKDIFRWVYPNICKKVAFKKFYDQPLPCSQSKSKSHYVIVVGIVPSPSASSKETDSETSTDEVEMTESDTRKMHDSNEVEVMCLENTLSQKSLEMDIGLSDSDMAVSSSLTEFSDTSFQMFETKTTGLLDLIHDLKNYDANIHS